MASSDEGGPSFRTSTELELDFMNDKYRELLNQLKTISAEKSRLERENQHLLHNSTFEYSVLEEKYNNSRHNDPTRYIKLCEELTKERNELKQQLSETEYEVRTVLSERGTVLKESQKLQDKNENLKKDLEKTLKTRDDFAKECAAIKEKLELLRSRSEFMSPQEEVSSSKDKMSFLSLEVANQEIERLKKLLDKVKVDVSKAVQESEIAKDRRDWAISEREKIVQERDSVRNLCDELRKERDTATSKLLAAIRDKDEAVKKIEQLNEKLETLNNAKKAENQEINSSSKRINTQQQHFATEEIEVDMSRSNEDLGIQLEGGCNEDSGDYNGNLFYPQVAYVDPHSLFFGKLQPNDYIHLINGLDCAALSKRMIVSAIRTSGSNCKILVKRFKPFTKGIYSIQIGVKDQRHGVAFDTGVFISDIERNSTAYFEPKLSVGDRVLSINDKSVESVKSLGDLHTVIGSIKNQEKLSLKIWKDFKVSADNVNSISSGKYSKMTNSCTQTEQPRHVDNSFLPIVPFIPTLGSQVDGNETNLLNNSISSSSPSSSKSASSKFTGMLQKIRDKLSNSSKDNQENDDAIAVLDSVLNSQDSLMSSSSKKSRRKSKNELAKSWPRATTVVHDNTKSHSGTMVFNRKKERPRLYLISSDDPPPSTHKKFEKVEDKRSTVVVEAVQNNQAINSFFNTPPNVPMSSRNSNRNSNPLPNVNMNQFMRNHHNFEKILPRSTKSGTSVQKPYLHSIHEPMHSNRYSLNLSSTTNKMNHQQHTFIPIKSCHSIESPALSKSPLELSKEAMEFANTHKMSKYFSNYSNNKYESDNENFSSSGGVSINDSLNNNSTSTLPSAMRVNSRNRNMSHTSGSGGSGMSNLYNPNHHNAHINSNQQSNNYLLRHTSPLPFPPSELANMNTPAISPSQEVSSSIHSYNSSIDYNFTRPTRTQLSREEISSTQPVAYQESGTFPRKKANNQIPIPSKPIKISSNSIDYCGTPDRSSPMPTFQVQIIKPGRIMNINKRNSMPEYALGYKPNNGELRRVHIDKSEKPLGIKIRCRNNGGGVFVSNVGENSIASQVGLQIGDQLLEVCGINMRLATYELAANVLRQCGNSITMLVQYNPEKYEELSTSDENVSRSDVSDSTPQNSPKINRTSMSIELTQQEIGSHSTQTLKSQRSTMSPLSQMKNALVASGPNSLIGGSATSTSSKEQPRVVYIETRKCPNLGVSLVGGNAYGIFINTVQEESIADNVGLRVGDQILDYNGTDLRRATAEYAAFILAKPADNITATVQYNIQKFNNIKDKPGDSFYVRVGFDRNSEMMESELTFGKDDVLYVDITMFRGVSGHWRAWKLDEYGHRLQCGIIPSQMKVEEELRLLGDSADGETSSRRSTTSARRSFFKRIKPQRGSSRDSKELASFSNTHLSLYLDPSTSDDGTLSSYQRVERLEYKYRPVLVIGALSEWVVEKLIIDFPEQFHRCMVNQMKCSKEDIEMRLKNNSIIEYRRRGSLYECVSLQAVKDNNNSHCMLDVNISAVERLHRNQVYPIVLLLRFKSAKQIKEIKDSRYSNDKLSAKQAKEMYEHALKLESEYKQYISVVIQAGVNITHCSTQIKASVDTEQKKILWIPTIS